MVDFNQAWLKDLLMDEGALWGLAFLVYILLITPKYLALSGEFGTPLYDDRNLNRVLIPWIIGFAALILFHYLEMLAITSFCISALIFGLSYVVIRWAIKY